MLKRNLWGSANHNSQLTTPS